MPRAATTPRNRYGPHATLGECDRRDNRLANATNWEKTAAQERFLTAFTARPYIASAARAAGVARCTVYRWLEAIPAFEKAVRDACEVFGERSRKEWGRWDAERDRWRREREKARHPMRCANLAKARAALQEALRRRGGQKHRPWD